MNHLTKEFPKGWEKFALKSLHQVAGGNTGGGEGDPEPVGGGTGDQGNPPPPTA